MTWLPKHDTRLLDPPPPCECRDPREREQLFAAGALYWKKYKGWSELICRDCGRIVDVDID